ncbi:MAG: cation diffusion facilitator family transporter [Flavipsychrobacter sp.]
MPIKIQRYIAFFSLILFFGKLWAWYLTHSVTILTDALESTVNVIAGFIGLYSIILAAKPRDLNHPYGHGKAESVSSAIEGALISIAGLVIIFEAISQLLEPQPIHQLDVGIYITGVTGVLNFFVGFYAERVGKKKKSLIVESAGKHLKTDAYSTFAIIIGLCLLLLTGWQWLDSTVALIFAIVIIRTGYQLIRRSMVAIMDEADVAVLKEVIQVLEENRQDDWIDLHNMRVVEQGHKMHIDAHMTLPWYYQVKDAEAEIHQVEDLVKEHFQNKIDVFIHVDACAPYSCKLCALQDCKERQSPFVNKLAWTTENIWDNNKHGKEVAN